MLAAELDELPGLRLTKAPGLQFRMRLELKPVINLQYEDREPKWGEPFGNERLHIGERVGLATDQMKGDPSLVLGLPILTSRVPGRLSMQRSCRVSAEKTPFTALWQVILSTEVVGRPCFPTSPET